MGLTSYMIIISQQNLTLLRRCYIAFLFLDESDIRGNIMFKTDVTQALLMLIFNKSPTHVFKRT